MLVVSNRLLFQVVLLTQVKMKVKDQKQETVDGQNVGARQTVAKIPSDYKQTEAKAYRYR